MTRYYENDSGTWTANGTSGSCTYAVAGNGRVSGCGGAMYLTAANTAVMVGNDAGVFAGYVMPQTVPGGGFTAVAGTFFGGTAEIVSQNADAETDLITMSTSATAISGTDINDFSSTTYQQADDVEAISGATLGSTGTITETQNSTSQVQGVAMDTTHFLMVNNASSSCPTISVFGPSTADTVAVSITSPTTAQSVAANGGYFGIIVNVAGTSNTGVTWTFNGLPSGSGYGTISSSYPSFTYTAPPRLPSPATFSITATSNADMSKSASVSVTITAGVGTQPLSITTTSLPGSTGGAAYVQDIQTGGGTLPIIWSVTSGSLPPGLGLQGTPDGVGTITGTPAASGSYTFTVTASDASTPTQYASQQFMIVVSNVPLRITTTALPRGTLGPAYSAAVAVSGGTTPYTWSVTGGALPGWATLNTSSGAITGTPGGTGTSDFTVTVTDSTLPTHQTVNQSLSITISGLPPTCSGAPTGNESMLNGQYAFLVQRFLVGGYRGQFPRRWRRKCHRRRLRYQQWNWRPMRRSCQFLRRGPGPHEFGQPRMHGVVSLEWLDHRIPLQLGRIELGCFFQGPNHRVSTTLRAPENALQGFSCSRTRLRSHSASFSQTMPLEWTA